MYAAWLALDDVTAPPELVRGPCGSRCRARPRCRARSPTRSARASASSCTRATDSPKRRRSSRRRPPGPKSSSPGRSARRCRVSRCGSSTPTARTSSPATRARSGSAGRTCSAGYWHDDERHPRRLLPTDGWLRTGDVAVVDDARRAPPRRPGQGPRHRVGVQRVPGRGRGGADGPPRRRRGRGRGRAERTHG